MAKYRKTALVEAEQFLPPHQIPEGCYQKGTIGDVAHGHGEWFLKTLEGEHPLRYADYICRGVQDERWNVERAIFEATYEPAAPEVEGLTSGEGDREDAIDRARNMLDARGIGPDTVHGPWVGHEDIVQVVADALATSPKATATASVREDELVAALRERTEVACDAECNGDVGRHDIGCQRAAAILNSLQDSGTAATIGGERYLVWSNEHKAWWGADHRGYTRFIDRAGRYDRAEALKIAGTRDGGWRMHKGNPDEIAIPEQDAIDQYADITAAQSATIGQQDGGK